MNTIQCLKEDEKRIDRLYSMSGGSSPPFGTLYRLKPLQKLLEAFSVR